ncbi:MAG: hypothetical protein ABII02_04020 [Candidatus Magasanikbacteria bacterium]
MMEKAVNALLLRLRYEDENGVREIQTIIHCEDLYVDGLADFVNSCLAVPRSFFRHICMLSTEEMIRQKPAQPSRMVIDKKFIRHRSRGFEVMSAFSDRVDFSTHYTDACFGIFIDQIIFD